MIQFTLADQTGLGPVDAIRKLKQGAVHWQLSEGTSEGTNEPSDTLAGPLVEKVR
jgi:hypothetical protein